LSSALTVTAVEIRENATMRGTPTGNWTIRIETDNGGVPSGNLADPNASVVVTPLGAAGIIKGVFATPFVLTGGVVYYMLVFCDNQADANSWYVDINTSAGSYANGTLFYSTNGGTVWTTFAADLYFKIYTNFTVPSYAFQSYVLSPDSADWNFGTGNFTIDFWVRFASTDGDQILVSQWVDDSNWWAVDKDNLLKPYMYFLIGGVVKGYYFMTSAWNVAANTWYHLAFVRNGAVGLIFIDGVSQTLTEITAFGTNDVGDLAANLNIGMFKGMYGVNGYIDEFRISKGLARWTVNFTPSTILYASDANTQLLLHAESLDASNSTPKIPIFAGTAQLDTAWKEFGSASLLLNGTTDYIVIPDSADWYLGAGNFTIDFWIRFASITDVTGIIGQYADDNNLLQIFNDDGSLFFYHEDGGATRALYNTDAAVFATNTWYHVAIVRNGSSFYMFVDGDSKSLTVSTAISTNTLADIAGDLTIGAITLHGSTPAGSAKSYHNGWMDEVRISKGIARWTSTFTPPVSAYSPTIENMTLQSIAFAANSTPNDVRITLFEEDVDSVTLNTDLKAWASRDNGSTWSQVTLESEGNYVSTKRILAGVVDIINQPVQSVYNMKYKITTHNSKNLKLYGVSEIW